MVSVCMAAYNGEQYIKEQVDSILCQLSPSDELIVSDDGSTDSTLEILRNYQDVRIKIYGNEGRHGVIGNFENAFRHARGEYVFLSDQDDVWLPGKISRCIEALKKYDLVVTDCIVVDSELREIEPSFFIANNSGKGFWKNLVKNTYLGACVCFRSSLLDIVLPIPARLPVYHEGWIASLADIVGRVCFLNSPCMYYRRHARNVSSTVGKSKLPLRRKLYNRLMLLYLISGRLVKYYIFCYKHGNKK